MSFLKNVEHSRYNIDDLKFQTFICKDCSTGKKKEYELCTDESCPKDLKNFGYISLNYLRQF